MKEWALSKGVTTTHWFQPLTGETEKHDAFEVWHTMVTLLKNLRSIGATRARCIQFPNGGIRNTFEARGYTAWDPTSPAFIYGTILCIPTVFISYTGEALIIKYLY
jgi:glutamine synthetase